MKFELLFETGDESQDFDIERPGEFVLTFGPTGNADFGGGNVDVSQNGIPYSDLQAVIVPGRHEVECRGGELLTITLANTTGTPDLLVKIHRKQVRNDGRR